MASQFIGMISSPNFFDVALFPLSDLVTGSSFMSISSLVLKLWQFSFIRDWPEIKKSEIPSPEFFPTSGDWSELEIPNLARIFRTTCYWMMQNATVTAFTFLSYYGQRWCKSPNCEKKLAYRIWFKDSVNVKERFSHDKSMMYHSCTFRCNIFNTIRLNRLLVIGSNYL